MKKLHFLLFGSILALTIGGCDLIQINDKTSTIVRGNIMDENNLPVAGFPLMMYGEKSTFSGYKLVFEITTETDSLGEYSFSKKMPSDVSRVIIMNHHNSKYPTRFMRYSLYLLTDSTKTLLDPEYELPEDRFRKNTTLNFQVQMLNSN